ncbi:hypothetical protein [Micrococcus terreus]|uniref:hypothetical protein n=1 Tax=Micrococcus terreus TaxID=574650 RepID=UPI002550DE94|nr:hypothetical protein [Micrococcus terreus]MDK7699827.1 hypothetical protein [Micrococcus terreus]WOO98223.1 hypothetical protein R3I42_03510 [Micrococcus terreus]
MMNDTTILDLVTQGIRDQYRVRSYRGGYLLTTSTTLTGGVPFQLRLQLDGDAVMLNDDGQVAQELDMAGYDIESDSGRTHWSAIQREIGFSPYPGSDPWELSTRAPLELLGPAVSALSEAAVQANALRILAPAYKPASMRERLLRSVAASSSKVLIKQNALMDMRGGGKRQVTFSATLDHTAYVQTISRSQGPNDGYDKGLGTFSAAAISRPQRVLVLDGRLSTWPDWQLRNLRDHAELVSGAEPDEAAELILEHAA